MTQKREGWDLINMPGSKTRTKMKDSKKGFNQGINQYFFLRVGVARFILVQRTKTG
jgi:hypothetical protein